MTCRGNHQERLFATASDRDALDELVADAVSRFGIRLHAHCWMTNHLHFLLQLADQPLGKIMQRIEMRYARHRHKIMNVTGHLFEKRYTAKVVDVDNYCQEVIRYIHLNPVYAGIVYDPAQYRWSSHRAYLGREHIPWLTTDFGLSLFSQDLDRARIEYDRFMKQPVDEFGSREQAGPALRQDSRILGSDEFAAKLSIVPPLPPDPLALEKLALRFCAERGLAVAVLRSPSRCRDLTVLRLEFARLAVDSHVATFAQVARFLNRSPQAFYRLLSRHPTSGGGVEQGE